MTDGKLTLDVETGPEPYEWKHGKKDAPLRVTVVDDIEAVVSLRPECRALREGSADRPVALDLPYFAAGWRVAAMASDARLRVVVIERNDTPVAIWPLYLDQRSGIIRHLGCGSREEYAGALGIMDAETCGEALNRLRGEGDAIEVYNLRPGTPLCAAIESNGPFLKTSVYSPIITVGDDPDAWRKAKSKSFRQSIRNNRSRLSRLGEIDVAPVPVEKADAFSRWMFATKREWLDSKGIGKNWIRSSASEAFFADLLGQSGSNVIGFAVTLDGKYIAGAFLLLARDIEFFVVANDAAYSAFSPGHLLLDGLVDFAADRCSDIDLRITQDEYKMRWADRTEERVSYVVALNWRGRTLIARRKMVARAKIVRRIAGKVKRLLSRKT